MTFSSETDSVQGISAMLPLGDGAIANGGQEELPSTPQLGALPLSERTIFAVSGRDFSGYIVAGAVIVDESDREYDVISPLLQS